jgi:flagellar basal body-associated protein FliL
MKEEQQTSQKPEHEASKGYGKRPLWQWLIIYLVAAIIVYGVIYFVFIHKGSSGGTGGYSY